MPKKWWNASKDDFVLPIKHSWIGAMPSKSGSKRASAGGKVSKKKVRPNPHFPAHKVGGTAKRKHPKGQRNTRQHWEKTPRGRGSAGGRVSKTRRSR